MLTALLAATLLSQGLNTSGPGASGGGKVLASYPLVTSGPLITEDANTVAHVYWNGTALVDSKGNAWTQNGTVPQVTANPFTVERFGSGPFSAANYYSLGTGTDVLDFAGDFTVCIVYSFPVAVSAERGLFSNGTYGAAGAGYMIGSFTTGAAQIDFDAAGNVDKQARTANVPVDGPNVVCAGRVGTTAYVKLNAGTTVTTAGVTIETGSAYPARIGQVSYSWSPHLGTIYEVYATSTPFTEATVVAIQQKVLGHFDGSSALAVTRATTATYAPRAADPSTLFTVPAGVARITDEGLLVEPARTNYALQSNTISTSTGWTSPWAATSGNITVATVAGAPMGGTWAEATSTGSAGYQGVIVASTSALTCSTWAAAPTGAEGLAMLCACSAAGTSNAPTITGCTRSDGGTCTTSIVSTYYAQASAPNIGTTPTRIAMTYTCASATTEARIQLRPTEADGTTSGGPTLMGGAQLEVGTYPTSLIVTTTTAATRNADAVTATIPAMPSKWCVAVTGTVPTGLTWANFSPSLWELKSGVNRFWIRANVLDTYDASNVRRYHTFTYTGTVPTRSIVCSAADPAGSPSLSLNGSPITLTTGGAGVGPTVAGMTSISIGGDSTGDRASGYLKNLRICRATRAKDCP